METRAREHEIEGRLADLVSVWERETRFESSPVAMRRHPAFHSIVDMGEQAVPAIVARLRDEPSFLTMALHAITGENPIRPGHEGRVGAMSGDWIAWHDSRNALPVDA